MRMRVEEISEVTLLWANLQDFLNLISIMLHFFTLKNKGKKQKLLNNKIDKSYSNNLDLSISERKTLHKEKINFQGKRISKIRP